MKALLLISFALTAATGPMAMAQTADAPVTAGAQQTLTAAQINTIKRRLGGIEREIADEYTKYLNAKMNPNSVEPRTTVVESRRPKVPHDLAPVSPRHAKLVTERTELEAKLAAAGVRP